MRKFLVCVGMVISQIQWIYVSYDNTLLACRVFNQKTKTKNENRRNITQKKKWIELVPNEFVKLSYLTLYIPINCTSKRNNVEVQDYCSRTWIVNLKATKIKIERDAWTLPSALEVRDKIKQFNSHWYSRTNTFKKNEIFNSRPGLWK